MTKGKMLVTFFAVVSVGIFSTTLWKNINKPVSYEDCLLKKMPEAQNNVAATGIERARRVMFPVKEISYEEMLLNAQGQSLSQTK